jgi:hypothetical protein
MKGRPKPLVPTENLAADADAILQVKFWLTGISPMVWRRVLVPSSFTLRELHGVIQVAMGWEGIHLYDFQLRAAHYGSWEVAAASPDVTLAALRFRKGARFIYEYDLNIPWRHEVRIEDRLPLEVRKTYPLCTGGGGACPPEDCGGPASFMARRDDRFSFDALEDLDHGRGSPAGRAEGRVGAARARPGDPLAAAGCPGAGQGSRGSAGSAVFAAGSQRQSSR